MRKIAFAGFTRAGCDLARLLARAVESRGFAEEASVSGPARLSRDAGVEPFESLAAWTKERFAACDALVFVSACGIAVRAIAPLVSDKLTDPAVVTLDERGAFCVPLLSGHVGGANDLARFLACETGGCAVVSTATDVNGVFAIDEWAVREGFSIIERVRAKEVAAALLEGEPIGFSSAFPPAGVLPAGFVAVSEGACAVGGRGRAPGLAHRGSAVSPYASPGSALHHVGCGMQTGRFLRRAAESGGTGLTESRLSTGGSGRDRHHRREARRARHSRPGGALGVGYLLFQL